MDQTHQRSVWLARDHHLDRLLTVKRLAGSDRELRSVALLSDIDAASLARVYGVHQDQEVHWLLSEFIDGVALASGDMLWPAQAVLPLLVDLTGALIAMADAGVVHCDISPGNVLIDVNGRVRLVDFGIAARMGEAVSGAGTPGFAAPEVVAAQCCTSAADLWSLAAMGCWLLTLEAPYWVTTDDGQYVLILPAWRPADQAARSLWSALQRALILDPASRP
ncbi:MAG: protein kinase, partial [Halieaceae bacterium]|nr:protein kinase [Halieaceae bacterium]